MVSRAPRHEHSLYPRSAIPDRSALVWPSGEPLAVAIVISAEYYEMQPPQDAFIPPNVPGMFGRGPYPDIGSFSRREYGNRVGIFRLLELLAQFRLPATVAMDATVAENYPEIVAACAARACEFVAHGISVTQVISSRMTEAEEAAYIDRSIRAVEAATGVRCQGWHGPEYGESLNTPTLLARQRLRYLLDWPNDEQPYEMTTDGGRIVSLPVAVEFDDVQALWQRRMPIDQWRTGILDAIERLVADGRTNGRVLILNLHPWLIGQPHRIGTLKSILSVLSGHDELWMARCGEIVDAYRPPSATGN